MNVLDLFKGFVLTKAEEKFLKQTASGISTIKMHQESLVTQMYFIKHLEKTDRAMNWLTGALVFVGIVQVIVAIIAPASTP